MYLEKRLLSCANMDGRAYGRGLDGAICCGVKEELPRGDKTRVNLPHDRGAQKHCQYLSFIRLLERTPHPGC
jgi:hypothetical protein